MLNQGLLKHNLNFFFVGQSVLLKGETRFGRWNTMNTNTQIISISECMLGHSYVEDDGDKTDGYVLDITFSIPSKLAKRFCTRSYEDMLEQSAIEIAKAEDIAHARYGGMIRMIKASKGEFSNERERSQLTDRSGFEDDERNRRIEKAIEQRIISSGVFNIRDRIVSHLKEKYPAESGFWQRDETWYVGVKIPIKNAPREVLDLAAIFKEGGLLKQAVTLEQARAETGLEAAPASQSYHDFLIDLNKKVLSSPSHTQTVMGSGK